MLFYMRGELFIAVEADSGKEAKEIAKKKIATGTVATKITFTPPYPTEALKEIGDEIGWQ